MIETNTEDMITATKKNAEAVTILLTTVQIQMTAETERLSGMITETGQRNKPGSCKQRETWNRHFLKN